MRYAPDLVVVFFVTNDIWYNGQSSYPRGAKPRFQLAGDSLAITNVPVPRQAPSVSVPPALGVWRSAKHFVREHSRLVRLAQRAVQRTAPLQGLGIRLGLLATPPAIIRTVEGRRTVPAEFSVLADAPSPQADTAIVLTARLLSRMQARSRAAGARFVVVFVPASEAVYPPGAARSARFHVEPTVGDAQRPSERFRDICKRARVPCVDPTPRFVKAADSLAKRNELLVFREDGHWNERGHRVAAAVLADLVRRDWALQAPHPGRLAFVIIRRGCPPHRRRGPFYVSDWQRADLGAADCGALFPPATSPWAACARPLILQHPASAEREVGDRSPRFGPAAPGRSPR
jgi:acetyltransferase AlgX (SGNH hydrolase-like protein)